MHARSRARLTSGNHTSCTVYPPDLSSIALWPTRRSCTGLYPCARSSCRGRPGHRSPWRVGEVCDRSVARPSRLLRWRLLSLALATNLPPGDISLGEEVRRRAGRPRPLEPALADAGLRFLLDSAPLPDGGLLELFARICAPDLGLRRWLHGNFGSRAMRAYEISPSSNEQEPRASVLRHGFYARRRLKTENTQIGREAERYSTSTHIRILHSYVDLHSK